MHMIDESLVNRVITSRNLIIRHAINDNKSGFAGLCVERDHKVVAVVDITFVVVPMWG